MTHISTLSKNELKILSSFFPEGKEITLKIIQRKSKLSYEPVHRIIKQLINKKLIHEKKFGKTLVYSLNFTMEKVKLSFLFYSYKKREIFSENYKRVYSALSKITNENADFLAIFGSYSKKTQTKKSDIDILGINNNKPKLESELKELKYLTDIEFSPIIMSKTEFSKIKKENKQFWEDLINYGIIFKGAELFYHYAYLK